MEKGKEGWKDEERMVKRREKERGPGRLKEWTGSDWYEFLQFLTPASTKNISDY